MRPQREEGWFTDPWDLHEARWFSDGLPTSLVRDGRVESRSEPPRAAPEHLPAEMTHRPARGGADLQRADAAQSIERPPSNADYKVAAWDGAVPQVTLYWPPEGRRRFRVPEEQAEEE